MKSSIIFNLLFLVVLVGKSQIQFEGDPIPITSINSPYGQNYLVLDPESANMAFTEESGGSGDENAIIELSLDSSKVLVFKDWLNTKGMVSPIGFMDESLLYNHVVFDKSVYRGVVIRLNLKTGNREKVDIPFMKNRSSVQSGCISANGQFLILSMESNNTYGVEDLYVAKKQPNGSWGSFSNLGASLNTQYQEITPFLAADNKTLFFASNGRGGEGSYDLFYSVRQDDSWRNWSEPVNLGKQINTSGAETSFAFRDGEDWAYFVSAQDSDGYGDIMKIKISEEIEEDTTVVEEVVATDTIPEEEPKSILLNVVDASTYESIPSLLIAASDTLINVNGLFNLDSLAGVEIEVKSQGYLPKKLRIDSTFLIGENTLALSSVAKGSTIQLENVLFQRGTANLISGSEEELDLIVEVLNDNPNIKILLKGHTDNTGDPVKNVKLSEDRVKTVKEYILSQGISAYRVRGKGYGGNQPIASNASEETRKLNRRVEFEVVAD